MVSRPETISAGNEGSLIVFSDDWGRHPSSCQHLIRQLLPRFPVLWVNTIGMRQPGLDWVTISRGWEKARQWLRQAPRPPSTSSFTSQNPQVVNPIMWPRIRFRWERRLNRFLLARQLIGSIERLPRPRVLVTTIPLVADLLGRLPVDRWVYYQVDDFRNWPAMPSKVIAELEAELVRRVDVIISAGQQLAQHISHLGRTPYLLTHGVDLEMWRSPSAASPDPALSEQTKHVEKPWLIFWGSVNWQVDPEFVVALAKQLNRGTLLFLGPVTDCDPILRRVPRVVLFGPVPYHILPWFAQQAAVLVMPYRIGPGLDESEPLKLREYLATDRPIVVRNLPANREWQDALDLVETPEEFAVRVMQRIEKGAPPSQLAARARVQEEGWSVKAQQFAAWLFADIC
ncbi:MAG: hypothetical protein ACUVQG_00410 [Thermogutta sp.]